MRIIECKGLTKNFGSVRAVHDLSFTAQPGRVTGFLGPNGAGKTTTLRMVLGLVQPDAGTATIAGKEYRDLSDPARTVGATLSTGAFHPSRSGRNHLRLVATLNDLPTSRVEEVLELVGLSAAAGRRVRGYSLGMQQRLALAAALLGDPEVLILDEPANGLDPDGIRWLREFLRELAAQGRTVLISSHMLAEAAQTVDDVIVIARGRSVAQGPLSELAGSEQGHLEVFTPVPAQVAIVTSSRATSVRVTGPETVQVTGMTKSEVAEATAAASVPVFEIRSPTRSLEDAFFDLVHDPDNIPAIPTGDSR
jgi:ABC-2 type transport system ATP-binding protein